MILGARRLLFMPLYPRSLVLISLNCLFIIPRAVDLGPTVQELFFPEGLTVIGFSRSSLTRAGNV